MHAHLQTMLWKTQPTSSLAATCIWHHFNNDCNFVSCTIPYIKHLEPITVTARISPRRSSPVLDKGGRSVTNVASAALWRGRRERERAPLSTGRHRSRSRPTAIVTASPGSGPRRAERRQLTRRRRPVSTKLPHLAHPLRRRTRTHAFILTRTRNRSH